MTTTNLNLVRVFVTVAEAGSFTAAGKSLEVPTSSVSRAIARLEAELSTTLLDRTSRRVSLTAAGRAYFEHARRAIDALEEGEARLGEVLHQPRGEVKLSIPIHLDGGFLAERLVTFARAYPQVRLRIVPTNRWVDVQHEGFDLALRVMQRPEGDDLVFRELGAFHAWLVASPAYLKEHGPPRRPADLTRHTCINLQSYTMTLRLIGPRGVESVEVGGAVIANDMHFVRQLAERGAGIGPLVFSPGDKPTLGSGLVRVLPDHVVEGPKLFVVSTSRKSQPLRVRLLRDALIEAYLGVTS
ncbi:MAG: LysR family transcriptional regulator [Deltaproteobacteria bacterium]|nr:LysR family transcriptional regulator [Deltaproteobacteria bacterium]